MCLSPWNSSGNVRNGFFAGPKEKQAPTRLHPTQIQTRILLPAGSLYQWVLLGSTEITLSFDKWQLLTQCKHLVKAKYLPRT